MVEHVQDAPIEDGEGRMAGGVVEHAFRQGAIVIDREAYRQVVSREVYGQSSSRFEPGKCLVRIVSTRSGITRSDAVIVADEGDFLFFGWVRCHNLVKYARSSATEQTLRPRE